MTDSGVAQAGMLIRRPPEVVFAAVTEPDQITRYWFTEASGPLAGGARVRWTWGMYGVSTEVQVKALEPGRRILMDWDVDSEPTEVEWVFEDHPLGSWLTVVNRGFSGSPSKQAAKAIESTGGFALVLAGLKVWLEHGIEPGLVQDRHPSAWAQGWSGGRSEETTR